MVIGNAGPGYAAAMGGGALTATVTVPEEGFAALLNKRTFHHKYITAGVKSKPNTALTAWLTVHTCCRVDTQAYPGTCFSSLVQSQAPWVSGMGQLNSAEQDPRLIFSSSWSW